MSGLQQKFPGLLDMPGEVRNTIYDMILNDGDDTTVCPFVWQVSPGKRKYGYSLTQTCRQIRDETLHMWHASSKLLFAMRYENMQYYRSWLARRPKDVFSSIRRIQLEDYQHSRSTARAQHPDFCRSAIFVNLTKTAPVSFRRDRNCPHCPRHDGAVDRVKVVVQTLEWVDGHWILTRGKLDEIFEAATWEVSGLSD